MSKSIRKNFLYSSILTTAGYIFPFITYPYVSRILGVSNIGLCNFIDGIISYFILFSMLGIGTIGIREIAKCKGNKEEISKAFSSLFLINTILTTTVLIIYVIAVSCVPKLYEHKEIAYVGAVKLFSNYLLIEWLYTGLEDFKYITKRSILVKCIYVVCVFLFIKNTNDYITYYILGVLMVVINAIINIVHSRKFVKISFKEITMRPYLKSISILGFYAILTSMYTSFNVAFLGFVTNTTQVGYYTTATKIYSILIALFTAFTNVMLPRMSSLLSEGKNDEFIRMIKKSVDALFAFSLPVIIMTTVFAPQIIRIISGSGYEGAIVPMRIVMPLMLIIGYAQILVIQILMPLQKDRAVFANSVLGAICGIILNLLLVPHWGAIGSAIVWIISEIIVTMSALYSVHKYLGYYFPIKKFIFDVIYHLPLLAIVILLSQISMTIMLTTVIAIIIFVFYVFVLQYYILKNEIIVSLIDRLHLKCKNYKRTR